VTPEDDESPTPGVLNLRQLDPLMTESNDVPDAATVAVGDEVNRVGHSREPGVGIEPTTS
jgi:hypothetical protein